MTDRPGRKRQQFTTIFLKIEIKVIAAISSFNPIQIFPAILFSSCRIFINQLAHLQFCRVFLVDPCATYVHSYYRHRHVSQTFVQDNIEHPHSLLYHVFLLYPTIQSGISHSFNSIKELVKIAKERVSLERPTLSILATTTFKWASIPQASCTN